MKKTTIRQLERCLVHDLGKQIRVTVTNRGSRLEDAGIPSQRPDHPAASCLFPYTGMRMGFADSISQMWVTKPIVLTHLSCHIIRVC
jgi:hypothetical protein